MAGPGTMLVAMGIRSAAAAVLLARAESMAVARTKAARVMAWGNAFQSTIVVAAFARPERSMSSPMVSPPAMRMRVDQSIFARSLLFNNRKPKSAAAMPVR